MQIKIADIRVDNRAQPRAALVPERVTEYVDDMARGDDFPPLVLFKDESHVLWLADGFHRYQAAMNLGLKTIDCTVRHGGLREAILYSCGANAEHGLRRTN